MAKLIEITGKVLSGEWGTDDESGNGIPVLRTTNFTNEGIVDYSNVVTRTIQKKNIDAKYLRKGDIIIEKSGGSDKQPVGRVIYFDGPESTYLFNNFTGLLRVKNQAVWLPRYVFYSLFHNYRKGGTRPFESKTTGLHNLKTDDYISRYEVLEAPISEQQSICKQLDYVYDIIKTRQQQLQKLDELVKARFVELFSGTYKEVSTEDVCSEIVDCPHSTPKYDEDNLIYPAIRTSEIQNGSISWNSMKYVGAVEYENRIKRLKPVGGDVVYAREGTYGDCVILPNEYEFCLGQRTMLFRPNYRICTSAYLHAALRSDAVRKQADESNAGSTVPHVNVADAKKFHFPLPPLELQNQFAAFVEQVDKSKVAVQKSLDEAQLLFDSLMQQYFG